MGKKRKTQNQKEKRAKKRREKEQWEATPILEKAGMVSFKSAGIETTTIGKTNPSLRLASKICLVFEIGSPLYP